MSSPFSVSRRGRWLLGAVGLLWLAALVVGFVAVPWLIDSAFDGESLDFLNRKIDGHRRYRQAQGLDATREWYSNWGKSYGVKAAVLSTAGAAAAVLLIGVPGARRRVRRFLFASSSPMNLAVLRIVAFAMLAYLLATEPILKYASWPRELMEWPAVGGVLLSKLPISADIAGPLLVVALVACGMAVFGLLTRTSAAVSVLLAFYLLGIPQSSGKVNHFHHVLLIGAVLACSRCGDALSFDSLLLAVRRADRGEVGGLRRAVRYGLPLRLSMLILAMVYFFPGFWKVASNGREWIFSDNLHNQLLQKWFELEHYTPPLPIHELPFASQMGALTAVVFELGFPIALLWRRSRLAWAALGLTFHNLTRVLMNISFMTLQWMYVMFVDWSRMLAWLGRRAYGEEMLVLYDNHCKLCRRTVAILDSLDWLSVVRPVSAFDRDEIDALGLSHLTDDALMQDMHVAWRDSGGVWRTAKGYAAYQALAYRVPKLWAALPVMHLPPVAAVGNKVYRRVADSRACQVVDKPAEPSPGRRIRWSAWPVLAVASLILVAQSALGVGRVRVGWPVACYPLFDQIAKPEILWPEFTANTTTGETLTLDDDPIRDHLGEARFVVAMKRFLEDPIDEDDARKLLSEFLRLWRDAGELDGVELSSVTVDAATYELTGPQRPERPSERARVIEVSASELASD